jgi:hypothetical protein
MALAEEDLASIKDLVNTTINGVVANLKKSDTLQRQKDAEAAKDSFGKLLDEKLSALRPRA